MAARIVQQFHGHSGSKIFLMTKHGRLFVRKQGNIARNLDRCVYLERQVPRLPMPEIYHVFDDTMDMEYINGIDMRTYLIDNDPKPLLEFLKSTLTRFTMSMQWFDYRPTVENFLEMIDLDVMPFGAEEILQHIPDKIPRSPYHGDLTLENILWHPDNGFYLIDAQSGIWDSYIFDICKLRQDIECGWFLRNNPADLDEKLQYLQQGLLNQWTAADNPALLILMLLRVYRYCDSDSLEQKFIVEAIENLWKS
jgi:hypothetical protein